jgi:ferric-dicitrate binding protein FerR (iron transport regulator)
MDLNLEHPESVAVLSSAILGQPDAALADLLRQSPETRRAYVELMHLHADLRWELCGSRSVVVPPMSSDALNTSPNRARSAPQAASLRWSGWAGAAVAAVAALAIGLWTLMPIQQGESEIAARSGDSQGVTDSGSVATLTRSQNVRFVPGQPAFSVGSELPRGPISLVSGTAQIMFESTAVVDLEGPCTFDMTGPNRGRLVAGTLVAHVPPHAHGFIIDLPNGAKIIDLGTRFRIHAAPDGQARVVVIEGAVDLICEGHKPIRLAAGQSRQTLADGSPASVSDDPSARWLARVYQTAQDPSVIAYYGFDWPEGADRSMAPNLAANSSVGPAILTGGQIVGGRIDGKTAMRCDDGGAAISIPQPLSRFTLAAWVRVQRPVGEDKPFPLLTSDAWFKPGLTNWSLVGPGTQSRLVQWREQIQRLDANRNIPSRQWVHLAVTGDIDTGLVRHYIDGEPAGEHTASGLLPVDLRHAHIGQLIKMERISGRQLPGLIDEFIIFDRPLEPAEIRELCTPGEPKPGSASNHVDVAESDSAAFVVQESPSGATPISRSKASG